MGETLCIVGLGYIGLPTACIAARAGYRVLGVDIDPRVLDALAEGRPHLHEPGLDQLLRAALVSGRLEVASRPRRADLFMITVPTPFREDRRADLSYVDGALASLLPLLEPTSAVIVESTVPVGTTEALYHRIAAADPRLADIHVGYCPERVIPGRMVDELVSNDRIVGGRDEASTERIAAFYETFVEGQVLRTRARVAEMCKLVENAYRDVNIAFANELSVLAEGFGLDVWEVIELANHHPRVDILQPGPGVGGHCIAVDPWFLISAQPDRARLLRAAREVNDSKPAWVVDRVLAALGGDPDAVIGCLGATYKANVADLRQSPALDVIRALSERHAGPVLVTDPMVEELEGVCLVPLETLLERARVLVLLVDHDAFRDIDPERLEGKALVDTRGVFRPRRARELEVQRP